MTRLLVALLVLWIPVRSMSQSESDSSAQNKHNSSTIHVDSIPEVSITGYRLLNHSENLHHLSFDSEDLCQQGIFSVSDLLQSQTNAFVKTYGPNSLATPSIRGSGAVHTQVYWNGLPINSPTLGQSDLAILNTELVERITVNYGSDLSNTNGALGGSIELDDQIRWSKDSKIRFAQRLGSFGARSSALEVRESTDKLYFSATAVKSSALNDFSYEDITHTDSVTARQNNADFNQYGGSLTVGCKLKNHELKLSGLWTNTDRGLPAIMGVPSHGERQLDDSKMGVFDYQYTGKKFQNQLKIGMVGLINGYTNPFIELESLHSSRVVLIQNESNITLVNNWSLNTQSDARLEQASSNNYSDLKSRNLFSNYIKLTRAGKRSSFSGLMRTEMLNGELIAVLPAINGWVTIHENKVPILLKWNASSNYRLPSLNDLYWIPGGNRELMPEQGYSLDMALVAGSISKREKQQNVQIKRMQSRVELNGFYSNISNWIYWTPNGQVWSPQNVKRVQNSGFEISVHASNSFVWLGQIQHLKFQGDYSFVDCKILETNSIDDESIGKSLVFVPRHNFKYSLSYSCLDCEITFGQCVTGRVYLDAVNQSYMPFYGPSYLVLSKEMKSVCKSRLKLGFKVNNLFNEAYQVMPYRPMPKINCMAMGELLF